MSEIKKYLSDKKINENDNNFLKIKDILNPNFGNLKTYCKFHFEYKVSHKRLQDFHNLCKSYSQLINNHKVNISDYNNFEELDDKINSIILENDNKKFAYKFISNKYKFLMDDDVIRLFGELRTIDHSHTRIQALLTSKLAAYKTIEEFKEAINKVINSFKGEYDVDTIEIEVIEAGGFILYKSDKYLICETPTFQSCKKLGSATWCIARSSSYFRYYAGATGKQHILYDFNYDRSHYLAKIGVTTNIMGEITHSYDNYDNWRDPSHTKIKTGYVYKPMSRESCIKRVECGHRFDHSVYLKLGITYEDIINIDKNYFLKLKEIDKTNIDDVIQYVQKRIGLRKNDLTSTYLELADNDSDILFKLLEAKFVYTEELLKYLKTDDVILKEYIRRFGDQIPNDIKLEKYLLDDNIFEPLLKNTKLSAYMICNMVNRMKSKSRKVEILLKKIFSLNIDTDFFYILSNLYFNKYIYANTMLTTNGFEDLLFKGTGLKNYINNIGNYYTSTDTLKKINKFFPDKLEKYILENNLSGSGITYYLNIKNDISDVMFNKYRNKLPFDMKIRYFSSLFKRNVSDIEDINGIFSTFDYQIIYRLINQEKDIISFAKNDDFFKILVKKLHKEGCFIYGNKIYHNLIVKIITEHNKDFAILDGIIPKKHIDNFKLLNLYRT